MPRIEAALANIFTNQELQDYDGGTKHELDKPTAIEGVQHVAKFLGRTKHAPAASA